VLGVMADTGQESQEFSRRTDPYRRELMAHCYRMLGSIHEAEDLVQETYLRAWKAYERFEERASMRTWLYRIATNACLTALEGRNRRPMPTALADATEPEAELRPRGEVPWLEPAPDTALGVGDADPGAVVVSRESVRLALIAALQHLPVRQRAVLVLRDVMRFRASEVAESLDMSTAAVNSLLQRARAQLDKAMPQEEELAEPDSVEQRALLQRFATAFENYDVPAMVKLFRQDAEWEMPPLLNWVRGPENIGRLIAANCPAQGPGDMVMVPVSANGQPAFAMYMRGPDGAHHAFQIQVLTVTLTGVSHAVAFFDESKLPLLDPHAPAPDPSATTLFASFGLPQTLP
jgi:RNA polymerase sigma-70 factor, ECF subfamily